MRLKKMLGTNSLSFKVLMAYMVGVVLSITLITVLIFWLVVYRSSILSGTDVFVLADKLAGKLQFDSMGKPAGLDTIEEDLSWVFESLKEEAAYRVLDEQGNTVLISPAGEAFWIAHESNNQIPTGRYEFHRNGLLVYGQSMPIEHDNNTWFLQVGVNARFYTIIYQGFALPFMGVGIFAFSVILLFVFGTCAYITLKYTLKPLRQVSESASAIAPRSIHSRLPSENIPAEIAPMVESFNRVLDRLERGYRIQQEFLATAAHELKTPLALIQAQIEMKESSNDRELLLNDVAHMARQVQQLLLLAEVSDEQNYNLATVSISEVVDEVVSYLKPMAVKAEVKITVTYESTESWQADRSALFILVKNLLENAIQHAPQGTSIQIEIGTSRITIRDWGIGIDEDKLLHIFKRFWRGAHRRDHGAGLGLAICQEIAQAHDWYLTARRMEPGLEFRLSTNL